MTQNEVNIIKNSVLDATEAYVDARLNMADFVKTQIGVTVGTPTKDSNGKYHHKVKCNATNGTSGITYNNVLSVGNVEFPADSVVFMIAPNAQFSNQFILGKLDNTPTNIVGGSIKIGQIGNTSNYHFEVDKNGNLSIKNDSSSSIFSITNQGVVTMTKGSIQIGSVFKIGDTGYLAVGGTTSTAPFYVSNAGALKSTSGTIGGFTITANALGTPLGSAGVGMTNTRSSDPHSYCLYAWDSSYNCRVYQGKITCSTGAVSGKGIYVYSGSDESGYYILYGHSSIYRSRDGYEAVFQPSSDKRLKKHIKDITVSEAKNLIYNLSPKKFEYKNKTLYGKGERYGFIAQEVRKNIDKNNGIEFITNKGYHGINYNDFIAPLCVIVKDQQKQIDDLRSKIEDSNG